MSLKDKNNAWIKPSGQFITVGYMGHNEWASDYFKEKYGWDNLDKIEEITGRMGGYPYIALHKLGWIRLLTWSDGQTKALGETTNPKLTLKQKETLYEWCVDNDFKYENLFK